MKYLKLLKQTFPNQLCSVYISEDPIGGLEVTIRVGDYFMAGMFSQRELADPRLGEDYIDREFKYMIEAVKGKLENDKEQETMNRRAVFGGRFA